MTCSAPQTYDWHGFEALCERCQGSEVMMKISFSKICNFCLLMGSLWQYIFRFLSINRLLEGDYHLPIDKYIQALLNVKLTQWSSQLSRTWTHTIEPDDIPLDTREKSDDILLDQCASAYILTYIIYTYIKSSTDINEIFNVSYAKNTHTHIYRSF